MADWRSSHALGESVAQKVRDANLSVLRSYRDVVESALAESEASRAVPEPRLPLDDSGATRPSGSGLTRVLTSISDGVRRTSDGVRDSVRRPLQAPKRMYNIFTALGSGRTAEERVAFSGHSIR